MNKAKRIGAIIGLILLVGIYIIAFIASLCNSQFTHQLFLASFYSTFIIPVMIYAYMMLLKLANRKKEKGQEDQEANNNHL